MTFQTGKMSSISSASSSNLVIALPSPENVDETVPTKEEWYYSGTKKRIRQRYQFCGDCKFKTPSRQILMLHVKRLHPSSTTALPPPLKALRAKKKPSPPNSIIKCSLCEYSTGNLPSMNLHKKRHRKKSEHECPLCSYSVAQYKNLAEHLNHHHIYSDREDSEEESPAAKTPLSCSVCQYSSWHQRDIKRHELQHTKNGPFQCPTCSYSTSSLGILNNHKKRHHINVDLDEEKLKFGLYNCDLCGFTTQYQTNFKNHKLGHIRNEKFKCHQCKFSSSKKKNIDFHVKNHHEKIYTSSEDSDGEDDQKLVPENKSALRNCYVKLLDISTSSPSPTLTKTPQPEIDENKEDSDIMETDPTTDEEPNLIIDISDHDEKIQSDSNEDKESPIESDSNKAKDPIKESEIDHLRTIYSFYCFMNNARKKVEMEALKKSTIEEKLASLKSRAKVMDDKLQSAGAHYKITSSKKAELESKIDKLFIKKTQKDSEFKEQKIHLLELNIAALKSAETADENEVKVTEERVKMLDLEVKELEGEIRVLSEEAKGVNEEAEEAEDTLRGIVQILGLMGAEMELHESQLKGIVGSNLSLRKISA